MEFLQVMQTVGALGAIVMILVGSDWVKDFLLSRIR